MPGPGLCMKIFFFTDSGIWLFDAGEGAQVQLMKSNLRLGRVCKVFITHLHGDHLFGLPPLMCTLGFAGQRTEAVELYGPEGLRHYVNSCLSASRSDFPYSYRVHELVPTQRPEPDIDWPVDTSVIPFHPRELPGSKIHPDENEIWHMHCEEGFTVEAVWVKHRIPCFSFVVKEAQRPGKLDAAKLKSLGVPPGPLYRLFLTNIFSEYLLRFSYLCLCYI